MVDLYKYLRQTPNPEIQLWIKTALNSYLNKKNNPENQGEIEHIIDYMTSDAAPKRLLKMSYAQAKVSADKWTRALQKRGKHIDDSAEIQVIKKYKDGFKLIKLVGRSSFEREGKLMAHCVASYYGRDCEVYSLRDSKNMPHCTFEVRREDSLINQIRGKGNGSIHPKYIKKVLSILKYFNLDVCDEEMANLGYIYLDPHEVDLIKTHLKDETIFKYKNQSYLFKGC